MAVWLETGITAVRVWREHLLWFSLNYFGGASVAILLRSKHVKARGSRLDYSALEPH